MRRRKSSGRELAANSGPTQIRIVGGVASSGSQTTTTPAPSALLVPPDAPRFGTTRHDLMQHAPTLDLVMELATNRDYYLGDQWVAIHALGSHVYTCLERVISAVGRVDPRPRPGMSPVVAACIAHGIDTLRSNEHVQATFEIRDRLHELSSGDAEEAEELALWLRDFRLSLPSSSTTGQRRLNLTLPQGLKVELGELAGDLGVSMSNLIVLCCCITLSDQPCVLQVRREELGGAVEKFVRRLRIRRRVSEMWLRELRKDGAR